MCVMTCDLINCRVSGEEETRTLPVFKYSNRHNTDLKLLSLSDAHTRNLGPPAIDSYLQLGSCYSGDVTRTFIGNCLRPKKIISRVHLCLLRLFYIEKGNSLKCFEKQISYLCKYYASQEINFEPISTVMH